MKSWLKQGDAYGIPVAITLDGAPLDIDETDAVEICIGTLRKLYPEEVSYDAESGEFSFPVTQEETFAMKEGGTVPVDVRVKLISGEVIGARGVQYMPVFDAISGEVL